MLWVLCAVATQATQAHDGRPIYIDVSQFDVHTWQVRVHAPAAVSTAQIPRAELGAPCSAERGQRFTCPVTGPRELVLQTRGPASPRNIMLRYTRLQGDSEFLRVAPGTRRIALSETQRHIWREYLQLGTLHIASGYDHLLFVLCLLFIAGGLKQVVLAVTGFTAAHSITLGLATLGYVRIAAPPLEACIALSVLLLAVELLRDDRRSLTWRYPVAVTALFGLLHGLGFAAALNESGLPEHHLFAALLAFNLGVEIGQLLFLALSAALLLALRRVSGGMKQATQQAGIGYFCGICATVWLLERLSGF